MPGEGYLAGVWTHLDDEVIAVKGAARQTGQYRFMDQNVPDDADPRERIARLEERIEGLSLKLEGCRKYALAARSAMALGAVLLIAKIFAVINLDPVTVTAAGAAVLGGIVLAGSNRSTAREIEAELREAEGERAALIGQIELRVVAGRDTVH